MMIKIFKLLVVTIFIMCFTINCKKSKSPIEDIVSRYFGVHSAHVTRGCWAAAAPCDTTFQTTVEFIDANGSITVKENSISINETYDFKSWTEEQNRLLYTYQGNTLASNGLLEFNTANDSFLISVNSGGSGGGTAWVFRGKAE